MSRNRMTDPLQHQAARVSDASGASCLECPDCGTHWCNDLELENFEVPAEDCPVRLRVALEVVTQERNKLRVVADALADVVNRVLFHRSIVPDMHNVLVAYRRAR